jgi:hypothetical protein
MPDGYKLKVMRLVFGRLGFADRALMLRTKPLLVFVLRVSID